MKNKGRLSFAAMVGSYVLWGFWGLGIVAAISILSGFVVYLVDNNDMDSLNFSIRYVHLFFLTLAVICGLHAYQIQNSIEPITYGWWVWCVYFSLLGIMYTSTEVREQMFYELANRRFRRVAGAVFVNLISVTIIIVQACSVLVALVKHLI